MRHALHRSLICDLPHRVIQAFLLETLPKKLGLLAKDAAATAMSSLEAHSVADAAILLLWVQAALMVDGRHDALVANAVCSCHCFLRSLLLQQFQWKMHPNIITHF